MLAEASDFSCVNLSSFDSSFFDALEKAELTSLHPPFPTPAPGLFFRNGSPSVLDFNLGGGFPSTFPAGLLLVPEGPMPRIASANPLSASSLCSSPGC